MLVAGLVTLVQLYSIGPAGGKVPIVMGTSSSFLGIFQVIVEKSGGGILAYGLFLGASIVGGLVEAVLGFFIQPLRKLFPPVGTGIVVLTIGLSLIPIGVQSFAGGMDREATDKELSGAVICDGLGFSFAALFGVLPNSSFSQNVGLVTMTKVVNRFALSTGALFLVLCGLCPKLAAMLSIMPESVLGGAAILRFSSIALSGIQLINKDGFSQRIITIISASLGLGFGFSAVGARRRDSAPQSPCCSAAPASSRLRSFPYC